MSGPAREPEGPVASEDVACPEYPERVESLLGALLWQRDHLLERDVCHRVTRTRDGLAATAIRTSALLDRVARGAARLGAIGVGEGDRVLVSLTDARDFLVAFLAVQAVGAIPVPLPTPGEAGAPRSFAARVRGVCEGCAPRLAIVEATAAFARAIDGVPSPPSLHEVAPLSDTGAVATLRDRPASSPAFIQYTSGSTGAPRGVVVTHGNVLANCRAIRDATAYTRADRMVTWLPLHHDMGLVGGLLTSLYCAAETWLLPPMLFLARPVTWLEALTRYAATLTVAPTFAYSLCARKVPPKQLAGIDLSRLRLAYVGAEPIDPATVAAFQSRFAPLGLSPNAIYPVYGLAEATLGAAFPEPGAAVRCDVVDRDRLAREGTAVPAPGGAAGAVAFVSVGRALPRHAIRIVDAASGEALPERRVGELVFEGASVSPGYYGDADRHGVLHTGDLAYVADGDVFIVDRIKDLVIVAGQNFAPSDIEAAAAEVSGLRRGRVVAFSRPGPDGTEVLHVVAEVSPDADRAPDELAEEARRRVRVAIGLTPASVTIVAPGSLERTSSGKIRRRACADAHAAGTLEVVRSRADVRAHRLRRTWLRLRHQGGRAARSVLDWLAADPR